MKLALPRPAASYDSGNEAQARSLLEEADRRNIKRDEVLSVLKFRDAVTGDVRTLSIASGAVVVA